jgi:hypothetical protein
MPVNAPIYHKLSRHRAIADGLAFCAKLLAGDQFDDLSHQGGMRLGGALHSRQRRKSAFLMEKSAFSDCAELNRSGRGSLTPPHRSRPHNTQM